MEMMLDPDVFKTALEAHLDDTNHQLVSLYKVSPLDKVQIVQEYLDYAEILRPYITEVGNYAHRALTAGKTILAEGAQGTLLDLDHGTYPFVTSSTPTAPGALVGLGLGVGSASRVVGVVKALSLIHI